MKLHVGCGGGKLTGYVNADLYRTPATDVLFDLQQPWPVATNTCEEILASHVVEHLVEWRVFFAEAWKALKPDGLLYVRVPNGLHAAAHWDHGHVKCWVKEAFTFFQPGYAQAIGNIQHQGWQFPYRIENIAVRLSKDACRLFRWRIARKLLLPYVEHFGMAVEELFVMMRPLKTVEAVREFRILRHPNTIPAMYTGWTHHLGRRELFVHEEPSLTQIGNIPVYNGYQ